ncbi:MAG: flavoprotein oxygenase family-like protein [Oscillospiraceae bacterium]|jgi:flavin reductase (DIM6/NTAB) family NADH-FMN oxidoreductase RutF|nr:flavoprotein oxygenase family-like protein [Oscillospiraceae bacterium]
MGFKQIDIKDVSINPFTLIGDEWLLITSGNEEKYNTMTASWGGVGVIWNKNVATVYIRPQRYTYEFVEKNELFSLSFFDAPYKDALKICGSRSGRDIDKAKETGLVPVFDCGTTYFNQAKMVLICKKMYFNDIDPEHFLDENIQKNYLLEDYHRMYIAEIQKVLIKE